MYCFENPLLLLELWKTQQPSIRDQWLHLLVMESHWQNFFCQLSEATALPVEPPPLQVMHFYFDSINFTPPYAQEKRNGNKFVAGWLAKLSAPPFTTMASLANTNTKVLTFKSLGTLGTWKLNLCTIKFKCKYLILLMGLSFMGLLIPKWMRHLFTWSKIFLFRLARTWTAAWWIWPPTKEPFMAL